MAAGVPSVGLGELSVDWVYVHLAGRRHCIEEAAQAAAAAYAHATLLLELPCAGDLGALRRRERIPLVARRPRMSREEARRRLGLPAEAPCVLVSFGGIGLSEPSPGILGALTGFHFVVEGTEGGMPANVTATSAERRYAAGIRYQDLVRAADAVVTKPGYGIVSDAIAAGTRIVYTERGDFPEYPILVAEMQRYLPCAHVSNEDLRELGGARRSRRCSRALFLHPAPSTARK